MGSSVRLGRIAGIEFGVNWSWLVVFALIVWTLASAIFPSTNPGLSKTAHIAMAIVAAFLFFLSLLLHEFGHPCGSACTTCSSRRFSGSYPPAKTATSTRRCSPGSRARTSGPRSPALVA
jgi:hypothetical protein